MDRFGKFQLLERIGEGGMAEIYLAKPSDAALSKLVAVKRILPQYSDDPAYHEMFKREGSIALRFRHHAIIAVHELGTVDGLPYMSMEYFPGKTMGNIMNKLRDCDVTIRLADKLLVIKNIAQALQYIHEFTDYGDQTEFIHRDISPHNIMVGFDGATKLIDFGIAKDASLDVTKSKMIKGKIAYMSPEQVRGEQLTKQTDIFSLGIVFWELLAEKKLFTGKTIQDVSKKVMDCNIPIVSGVSATIPNDVAYICHKALATELTSRYRTASEMVADIDMVLGAMAAERQQLSLARSVQQLFPKDLLKLKRLLREHERATEGFTQTTGSFPAQRPTSAGSNTNSIIELLQARYSLPSEVKTRLRSVQNHSTRLAVPLLLAAILAIGFYIGLGNKLIEFIQPIIGGGSQTSVEAPVPIVEPVVFKPPPEVLEKAVAPIGPPTPPIEEVRTIVSPPAPPPVAKKIEPHSSPIKPVAKSIGSLPNKKSVKVGPKKSKREPATKKIAPKVKLKREMASTPVVESPTPVFVPTAYLTVLAAPGSSILIEGKIVGTEVVNEIRVPASKLIEIKVVPVAGHPVKTKSISFKPMSRNVIEMSGQ